MFSRTAFQNDCEDYICTKTLNGYCITLTVFHILHKLFTYFCVKWKGDICTTVGNYGNYTYNYRLDQLLLIIS